MKVIPTSSDYLGNYIWLLGRDLLSIKRSIRQLKKLNVDPLILEFEKGRELECHNNYYGAKEYFREIFNAGLNL